MKLYVFKAVGSYFSGATGVIAESAEQAVEFVESEIAKHKALEEAAWDGGYYESRGKYPNYFWRVPYFLTSEESTKYLSCEGSLEYGNIHFVLAHAYNLDPRHIEPRGVAFQYVHEG